MQCTRPHGHLRSAVRSGIYDAQTSRRFQPAAAPLNSSPVMVVMVRLATALGAGREAGRSIEYEGHVAISYMWRDVFGWRQVGSRIAVISLGVIACYPT